VSLTAAQREAMERQSMPEDMPEVDMPEDMPEVDIEALLQLLAMQVGVDYGGQSDSD